MGDESIGRIDPTSSMGSKQAALQKMKALSKAEGLEVMQEALEDLATERTEDAIFNPFAQLRKAETLDSRIKKNDHKSSSGKSEESDESQDADVVHVEGLQQTAEEYQNQNPELDKRALLGLKQAIQEEDSIEEILEKILASYPEHYLADEALEYIFKTTDPFSKLAAKLKEARELLNKRFAREIKAGRNVSLQAREFAKQGLGSSASLRDLYRDITGNPREPLTLFEELIEAYTFDKMKAVIDFMLHSLGSDMKSKGPSIDRPELQRLFTEIRTMQSILGVYRFFFQRMNLIVVNFDRENLVMPEAINFEVLSKIFVQLLAERYPSPDKILKFGNMLGISDEIVGQIIIFTQFRDAMRGVSPRLFKSEKHRQDLLMVLIETISELDDLLEESIEEDDEHDQKPKHHGWSSKDSIE
jgi:type III secretion protein W